MRGLFVAAALMLGCAEEPGPEPASAGQASMVDSTAMVEEMQLPASDLASFDFENRLWYVDLPGRLDEVSGLAFTPDGRLFAHDDERARLHEIDPTNGVVGKRFDLGEELVRGDFEGIVVVGERFFLVTSVGLLYEFREGADRESVAFRVTETGFGANCEIEGLEYDVNDDALLFACKVATPQRGLVVVHRLPIDPEAAPLPDVLIRRDELEAHGVDPDFAPSGIAVGPLGSLILVSARHDALVEIDRTGRVLAAVSLRGGRHPQSEGLAFGPDGVMYIADEKNGKEPRITAYGPAREIGSR